MLTLADLCGDWYCMQYCALCICDFKYQHFWSIQTASAKEEGWEYYSITQVVVKGVLSSKYHQNLDLHQANWTPGINNPCLDQQTLSILRLPICTKSQPSPPAVRSHIKLRTCQIMGRKEWINLNQWMNILSKNQSGLFSILHTFSWPASRSNCACRKPATSPATPPLAALFKACGVEPMSTWSSVLPSLSKCENSVAGLLPNTAHV